MDVELAEERILVLADRFNLDHAEGRAWAKRTDAFGTVAKPKFLLDAGVEAVNLFVPGTQLARIVVQHGVKHVIEHRKHEA
jgi:hypothetical protein